MHFAVDRPTLLLRTVFHSLMSLPLVFASDLREGSRLPSLPSKAQQSVCYNSKLLTCVGLCGHAHIYEHQCYISSTFEFTDNRIKTDNT